MHVSRRTNEENAMNEEAGHTQLLQLESEIVKVLKTIFDPEIPVNIYDLGLIYDIIVGEDNKVRVIMTLTAPNCPIADQLLYEVKQRVSEVEGVAEADIELVFDPPWDQTMMSEEALLELGMM
jgi:FeS assembly SUF system protein